MCIIIPLSYVQVLATYYYLYNVCTFTSYIYMYRCMSIFYLQPPKVRQRFTLKPKTPHIVCMRSIEGIIEQSKDFVDSAIYTQKMDWVSASLFVGSTSSYTQRRLSDLGTRQRPKSASFTGGSGSTDFLLASTPDLSRPGHSEPPPVSVNMDLFSSNSSGTHIHMCMYTYIRMMGSMNLTKLRCTHRLLWYE